ncbi:class I SAM-dependent methyltransferase [soil metagenome]
MAEQRRAAADLARYYDLDTAGEQADLDLYLALAASAGGPLLELAAGTGRVALPLAAAGNAVTAVDRDPHMLARARRTWDEIQSAGRGSGELETIEAEISGLHLERRFALVILALNTLLLLPGREAQRECLQAMARHLAPDGRAVIDVWLPAPEDLGLYDGRLTLEWLRRDEETGEMVAKLFSARHDAALATARVHTLFDAWSDATGSMRRLARADDLSFLSAHELLSLAGDAGLDPTVVAQDYSLTSFGTGSERMVLVCSLL